MDSTNYEEIPLTKERLHWGIITPALLLAFFLILGTLPLIFILNSITNLFGQLNRTGVPVYSNMLFLVLLPEFVLVGATLAVTLAAYFTSEISLTNRRLLFRTGFLSRHSGELPLENVESIFIVEPFIGRLFGYATITVTSVGGNRFPLHYTRSPKAFHATLQSAVNNAKTPARPKNPPNDDFRYMPKG